MSSAATLDPPATNGLPSTERVNILLVDDEPKNLTALEAILASPDRTLVQAHSGPEALRYLLRDDFAVILLDVHMPDMDGFETAELIRGRERSRDTPIIFLTAASRSEAWVARGYSVGAVDYIVKPFDPAILRSKVAVFVELFKKTVQVQRQAEQLAQTSALLNSVLHSLSDHAILATDLNGVMRSWNEGARHVYGHAPEEVVDRLNVRSLFVPEDVAAGKVRALFDTARRSGKAEGEFEHVRRDGGRFLASVAVDQRKDAEGRLQGFVAITRDITERRRMEQERARLIEEQAARAQAEAGERRMAFLAEASRVLAGSLESDVSLQALARLVVPSLADVCFVYLMEEDGQVRRVATEGGGLTNAVDGAADATGEGSAPSVPCADDATPAVTRVVRTGKPWLLETLDETALAEVGGGATCLEALRALAPRSALVVPLIARERTLGALTLVTAAPDRVYGPSDLAFVQDLAYRTALAVDNARLYAEARAAVRVRDEFLSSATHDLKTPLTVIKGQAQLLQRRAARLSSPESTALAQVLERIDSATSKMVALIDQMLDVAHLQMGKPLDLNRGPTDLVALTREAVEELAAGARARHQVVVKTSHKRLVGHWDAARLERVLGNLLSNAIKYSPDGGEVVVEVSGEQDASGQWAVVNVRDSGVGIPADELPRVFERFYRGRNVVGRIAGTGIGLAGVRQIVEEHGGSTSVQSQEGVGTTMCVRLPIMPPEAARKRAS